MPEGDGLVREEVWELAVVSENIVFISWSKEPAKSVAKIFHKFIQVIVPNSKSFMSQIDIDKGTIGLDTIEKNLASAIYGVVIVAKTNLKEPWIYYETGSLSKGISENQVSPFLFDTTIQDIAGTPLNYRQFTEFKEEDLCELFISIGRCVQPRIEEAIIDAYLRKFLPEMLSELNEIDISGEPEEKEASPQEKLLQGLISKVNTLSLKVSTPSKLVPEKYLTGILGGLQGDESISKKLLGQLEEITTELVELKESIGETTSSCADIVFDLDNVIDDLLKGDNFEKLFEDELKDLKRIVEDAKSLESERDFMTI